MCVHICAAQVKVTGNQPRPSKELRDSGRNRRMRVCPETEKLVY